MSPNTFPRVALPGITDEDREGISFVQTLLGEVTAHERHIARQKRGVARAMVALGKPVFRVGKPKPKRPTKNVRHRAAMRTRSNYLNARAFDDGETELAAA